MQRHWIGGCLPLLLLVGAPTDIEPIAYCFMLIVVAEGGIIYGVHDTERVKARLLIPRSLKEAKPFLFSNLRRLPDFELGQWCVLPALTGKRALAVNANHTAIALVTHNDLVGNTGTITTSLFKADSIQSVELIDTEWIESDHPLVSPHLKILLRMHHVSLPCSDIFNAEGQEIPVELPAQSPINQPTFAAPLPSPDDNKAHHSRQLSLKLTLNDARPSTEHLYFFLGNANANAEAYALAQQQARYWQSLLAKLANATPRH